MDINFEKDNIKLFVSDFDGVFTDRKLTVYSDGSTSKKLDYFDLMGIANLLKAGINVAIISGETSAAIDMIKQKFPSVETFQNIRNKIQILKELVDKYGLTANNVLYVGDDINDTECLNYAAIAYTVNDAYSSIKQIKNIHVTSRNGGNGAIREITDLLTC